MKYLKTKRVEMKYPWKLNRGFQHSPILTDLIKDREEEQNTNNVQISENNVPKENHTVKQEQATTQSELLDQHLRNNTDEKYKVQNDGCMNEFVVNLHINNLCGNNNEVSFCPPEISVTEGNLMDLNEDSIYKILDTISNIPKDELRDMPAITVPIYVFNINNILSSGNKNKTTIKQDA